MHQVQPADEEIGDAHKQKVAIFHKPPGAPKEHKNAHGYDYAEDLNQAMEEQVIILSAQPEAHQHDARREDPGQHLARGPSHLQRALRSIGHFNRRFSGHPLLSRKRCKVNAAFHAASDVIHPAI